MLIIVEGPPSSGKTTLVRELSLALTEQEGADAVTVFCGAQGTGRVLRGNKFLRRYVDVFEDYAPDGGEHIICDEWHITRFVYNRIFSPSTGVQGSLVDYVDLKMAQLGAVVVACDASDKTLNNRMDRINAYLRIPPRVRDLLPTIREAYEGAARRGLTTVIPTKEQDPDQIITTARLLQDQAREFYSRIPWYLGPTNPQAVLCDMAFTEVDPLTPSDHSSAFYLHRALELGNVEPRLSPFHTFGLLNTAFLSAQKTRDALRILGHPRVMALGPITRDHLTRAGVAHDVFRHPGVMRLHHLSTDDQFSYGRLLYTAAQSDKKSLNYLNWDPTL